MAVQFNIEEIFLGQVIVIDKSTGQPVSPQPVLSNVSITSVDTNVATVSVDASDPSKATVNAVAPGTTQLNLSADADFGGGNVKNFSAAVTLIVDTTFALDFVGVAQPKP